MMEDKAIERLKIEKPSDDGLKHARHDIKDSLFSASKPRDSRFAITVLLIFLAVSFGVWMALNKPAEKKRKPPEVPVTSALVQLKTLPLEIKAIGNVTPISSIAIKSRISGHIISVAFKEGDSVEKGQLLFRIDPRPLEAAVNEAQANLLRQSASVKQAQAQLAKDRAVLAQAIANKAKDNAQLRMWNRQISRYKMLASQGAVSQESYDQVRSSYEAAEATIQADEALGENCKASIIADEANVQNATAQLAAAEAHLQNAKLQLNYTSIISPIRGRTGSLQAFEGNLVKPDDNTLVVINSVSPIYVSFNVPEQAFQQIRKYESRGALKVSACPLGTNVIVSEGVLTFSENSVDTQTGTIKLKATFENANSALWPGQFVNVTLKLSDELNVVTVPEQAVQEGQQGPFVFVLDRSDMTVAVQPVKVERTIDHNAVIGKGLRSGQIIITDGQLQLKDGAKVKLKEASPAQQEQP